MSEQPGLRPACRGIVGQVDLRKLQWSIGFDVVGRYRRLRDFHRQAGFEDEAQWLDKRLRNLAPPR
ncbi:MAG: hypothetical protein ABSC21_11745 [Terriglobia bacterium]